MRLGRLFLIGMPAYRDGLLLDPIFLIEMYSLARFAKSYLYWGRTLLVQKGLCTRVH